MIWGLTISYKDNMDKVVKRNGDVVDFNERKIENAVLKAFEEVYPNGTANIDSTELTLRLVNERLAGHSKNETSISVEDIQDIVEQVLMGVDVKVAKAYITYRYKRALARNLKETDEEILSLLDCVNEEAKQENSNKNPTLLPTKRD